MFKYFTVSLNAKFSRHISPNNNKRLSENVCLCVTKKSKEGRSHGDKNVSINEEEKLYAH